MVKRITKMKQTGFPVPEQRTHMRLAQRHHSEFNSDISFALDGHRSRCARNTLKLRCGFISQSFPNFVISVYSVYWFNDQFLLTTGITNLNEHGLFCCRLVVVADFLSAHLFSTLVKKVCMLKNKMFVCDFCYDFNCALINTNTLFVWWLPPPAGQKPLHGEIGMVHTFAPYITLWCQAINSFSFSRFVHCFECVIKHFVLKWVFVNFDLCILSFRFSDRHICHHTFDLRSLGVHVYLGVLTILHSFIFYINTITRFTSSASKYTRQAGVADVRVCVCLEHWPKWPTMCRLIHFHYGRKHFQCTNRYRASCWCHFQLFRSFM